MNVSRLRRKLIHGRRHLERSGIAELHCWAIDYSEYDTKPLHRVVARLARRKYLTEISRAFAYVAKMDSENHCDGYNPWSDSNCGGCGNCLIDQAVYNLSHWEIVEKMARGAGR